MYSIIPIQKILMRILLYSIDVYVNIDMYMYVDEEYIDINMNFQQQLCSQHENNINNISWIISNIQQHENNISKYMFSWIIFVIGGYDI